MIKEVIFAPIVGLLLVGFMLELTTIAENASDKVLNYADDMNNALDCAFRSVDIYKCSPELEIPKVCDYTYCEVKQCILISQQVSHTI